MSIVEDSAHLAIVELEDDIYSSLREQELSKLPASSLVGSQTQITWDMRPQLMEFLAQAQSALELLPETLTLAVSILDRYMSKREVFARHYQLLGCVCLWLAAKTMDAKNRVPNTATLAYLCAGTYAESMFSEMELHVLTTLDWSVLAPVATDFVDLSVGEVARTLVSQFQLEDYEKIRAIAHYVCECSLFIHEMIGLRPSVLASTAVAFGTIVVDAVENKGWAPVYPRDCESNCFDALVSLIANPPEVCVARYGDAEQCGASGFCARFYSLLATSSRETTRTYGYKTNENSIAGHAEWYMSEPSTPVRSRQVSLDYGQPITPFDEDIITPVGVEHRSPSYFMPLTPMENFGINRSEYFVPANKVKDYY